MKFKLICRLCSGDDFFFDNLDNSFQCMECGGFWDFEDMRYMGVEEDEI